MDSSAPHEQSSQQVSANGIVAGVLPLLTLWSFGIAQPLFDLLLQNPTYLTAHALLGVPLIVFVVVIGVAFPLALFGLVVWLSRLLPRFQQWGRVLHGLIALALLVALLNGLVRKSFTSQETVSGLVAAMELGLIIAVAALILWFGGRKASVLGFMRMAALSAVIFSALFLWQLPTEYLRGEAIDEKAEFSLANGSSNSPLIEADVRPDIVLVVFDELALTTLLDSQLELDSERFPHFSRFAGGATWFTQASAVAAGTRLAVPAILTGNAPDPDRAPDASSHPRNLFSMLGEFYTLNVEEPITRLCNLSQCRRPPDWPLVVSDTAVLIGHIAGPRLLARRLPAIGGHWVGFAEPNGAKKVDDRVASINQFVEGIESADSPGLHVLHSVLPHIPYTILPTGARLLRHSPSPAQVGGHVIDGSGDRFTSEAWATTESRYMYEWQLRYVDRALGRIIDSLEASSKYDQSLVIVTADHGVRFVSGMSRREPEEKSFLDIAAIPLFVKLPGQTIALRDSSAVQSTDIVGLIEQVLSGRLSAGDSLKPSLGQSGSSGRTILSSSGPVALPAAFDFSKRENLPLEVIADESRVRLEALLQDSVRSMCSPLVTVELAEEQVYQQTHPKHFLAAHVLFRSKVRLKEQQMVVNFNDRVFAVHQTGAEHYSAFVDPELFRPGFNDLELVRLGSDGNCSLYKLAKR